jgi:uncharacterized RDD family membrane protein YckC
MDDLDEEIAIGEGVRVNASAASVLMRLASGLIDAAATFLVLWILSAIVGALASGVNEAAGQAVIFVFVAILLVGIPATVETLTRGYSLGRFALGIRIVRDDGGPVSARQAFMRALVGIGELWATAGTVAFTVSMLSNRSKRLGDMAAGTYAMRTRGTLKALPPVVMPPALAEWSRTVDISRLPDGLALTARLFLGRAGAMHPAPRAELGTKIASRLYPHVSPQPPFGTHPETYIAAVLATRRDREYAAALRQASRSMSENEMLRRLPYGVPDADN